MYESSNGQSEGSLGEFQGIGMFAVKENLG